MITIIVSIFILVPTFITGHPGIGIRIYALYILGAIVAYYVARLRSERTRAEEWLEGRRVERSWDDVYKNLDKAQQSWFYVVKRIWKYVEQHKPPKWL